MQDDIKKAVLEELTKSLKYISWGTVTMFSDRFEKVSSYPAIIYELDRDGNRVLSIWVGGKDCVKVIEVEVEEFCKVSKARHSG